MVRPAAPHVPAPVTTHAAAATATTPTVAVCASGSAAVLMASMNEDARDAGDAKKSKKEQPIVFWYSHKFLRFTHATLLDLFEPSVAAICAFVTTVQAGLDCRFACLVGGYGESGILRARLTLHSSVSMSRPFVSRRTERPFIPTASLSDDHPKRRPQ